MASLLTRAELHRRVWHTPLSRLAPELGLSDNGLRKLCHRYNIDVPPRGFWARLAAGQNVTRPPLASPSDDPEIRLPTSREIERKVEHQRDAEIVKAVSATVVLTTVSAAALRPTLNGCHPLIAGTKRYFDDAVKTDERRKKEAARPASRFEPNFTALFGSTRTLNGRYAPNKSGCLRVVATPRNIDWILRYHDALFRMLQSSGCTVKEGSWNNSQRVEIHAHGEQVELSFAEEFVTRARNDPKRPWDAKEYLPKDSYKVKIDRTFGGQKMWAGTPQHLEELLPTIAGDIVTMLAAGAGMRRQREAEQAERDAAAAKREEERQAAFAIQKRIADRKAATRAQLDRAVVAAKLLDEFLAVQRLLSELHGQATSNVALQIWIAVVEGSLVDPRTSLTEGIRGETENQVPLWWPDEPK